MQALSIQPLTPVSAQGPSQLPVGNDVMASQALKRIDSVCVVVADAADSDAFVVQVFLAPPSMSARLSTTMDASRRSTQLGEAPTRETLLPSSSVALRKAASSPRKPDVCIERSYAKFLALRSQLQQRMHVAHGVIPCAFCREVSSVAVWGGTYSSPLAMLAMTQADRVKTFSVFVNELLELTKTPFPSKRARSCSAQQEVPQLLHAFLT